MAANAPIDSETSLNGQEAPDLPAGWEYRELRRIASLARGISWSKKEEDHSGVPVVAIPNVKNGRVNFDIRYRVAKRVPNDKLLHEGDILLVGSSGSLQNVGRTAMVPTVPFPQCSFASFLAKASPTAEITRDYLYYLLMSPAVDYAACSNRAADGKHNLQVRMLKQYVVPRPPIPEQRAIAHVLRTVQQAREATENVITALQALKQSLMRHLFTHGPVPIDQVGRVKLKETEIGPVPEGWELMPLSEIGKLVTGRTPSTKRPEYWDGDIPFVTPGDLNGGVISDAARRITQEGLKESRPLSPGAVLVSCIGYIGKIGVVGAPVAVTNQQINAVVVDPKICNERFLAYQLPQQVEQLASLSRQTTVPIVSKSNFGRLVLAVPPLEDQVRIAETLLVVDERLKTEEDRVSALLVTFHSLLHHLMTAKVRLSADFVRRFETAPEPEAA